MYFTRCAIDAVFAALIVLSLVTVGYRLRAETCVAPVAVTVQTQDDLIGELIRLLPPEPDRERI